MSDDRNLEEMLRRTETPAPAAELRSRVIGRAREARQRTRRRWTWGLSAAAAWFVIVVAGVMTERAESARMVQLVDGMHGSAASEVQTLARELRDVPGAERLANRMLVCRVEDWSARWPAEVRTELKALDKE